MLNSRKKGHDYERKIAKEIREWYEDCLTAREGAGTKVDADKIDLVNTGPFNIQLKAMENLRPNPHDLLKSMPDNENWNVVFHKKNRKGTVVFMTKETFYELIEILRYTGAI